MPNQTNKQFAIEDRVFIKACTLAGIITTTRQASRWLNGKGKAIKFKNQAIRELAEEINKLK